MLETETGPPVVSICTTREYRERPSRHCRQLWARPVAPGAAAEQGRLLCRRAPLAAGAAGSGSLGSRQLREGGARAKNETAPAKIKPPQCASYSPRIIELNAACASRKCCCRLGPQLS